MNYWTARLIAQMHRGSKLTREDVWIGETVYRPTVRKDFAEHPRIGYIGEEYRDGGWVLVGSNGNSTEGRDESEFRDRDARHILLMKAFRKAGTIAAFSELNKFERMDILSWDLDWAISGTLQRLSLPLEAVAVVNVIPFSSKNSPPPSSSAWPNACRLHFQPLIDCLSPGGIVWLGKAARQRSLPCLSRRPAKCELTVSRQRNLSIDKRFSEFHSLFAKEPRGQEL